MQLRGVGSCKLCLRSRDKSADIGSFYAEHRRDLSLVFIRAQVLIKGRSQASQTLEFKLK